MGEKVGMIFVFVSSFVASLIIAFSYGWLLTLILFALMIPVMVLLLGITAKFMSTYAGQEMKQYGKAGAVAEEVLAGIRTVVAFDGQEKEVERSAVNLLFIRRFIQSFSHRAL